MIQSAVIQKPAEINIDVIDALFYADSAPAFRWLHEHAPVYLYDPRPKYDSTVWIFSTWEDIRWALGKTEIFCHRFGTFFSHPAFASGDARFKTAMRNAGLMDPPEHTRHRRLVNNQFRPARMHQLEEPVREIVQLCLADVGSGETADFTTLIANRVPLLVICDLLGVDRACSSDFSRWVNAVISAFGPNAVPSYGEIDEMLDFFEAEVDERMAHPRDDIITDLTQAEHHGDRFTKHEMVLWCWNLLAGGAYTTADLLGGGVRALLDFPHERLKLLDNPALIDDAVEEMLRYVTPNLYHMRTATRDVVVRATQIREGDKVFLSFLAGNRDPAVFEDPYQFDISRPRREHLSFAHGRHKCLAAPLARLTARIVFQELLERFPQIEWGDAWIPDWNTLNNRPGTIPVTFSG